MGASVSRSRRSPASLYRLPRQAIVVLLIELLLLTRLLYIYGVHYGARPLVTSMVTYSVLTALSDTLAQCFDIVRQRIRNADLGDRIRLGDAPLSRPQSKGPNLGQMNTSRFDGGGGTTMSREVSSTGNKSHHDVTSHSAIDDGDYDDDVEGGLNGGGGGGGDEYDSAADLVHREMLRGAERRYDLERTARFWTYGFLIAALQYRWFELLDQYVTAGSATGWNEMIFLGSGGVIAGGSKLTSSAAGRKSTAEERAYFATPGRPDDATMALLAEAYANDDDGAGGIFSASSFLNLLKRLLADQAFFSPIALFCFFAYMALAEGALFHFAPASSPFSSKVPNGALGAGGGAGSGSRRRWWSRGFGVSFGDFRRKLARNYMPALKAQLMVWPLVQLVNFAVVPQQYRVPVVGGVSVGWNLYLSLYHTGKGRR